MASPPEIRARWLAHVLSTEAADRPRAESAVRDAYLAGGFTPPSPLVWFDSPMAAAWAVACLVEPHNAIWKNQLATAARSRDERERVEAARAALLAAFGTSDWRTVLSQSGPALAMTLQYPPITTRLLHSAIVDARVGLSDDISALFVVHGDEDDLARAEDRLWGPNRGVLVSELHGGTAARLMGSSAFADYSFSMMADDEAQIGSREAPGILRASWEVARASGLWWPFAGAAILSERPVELHTNERHLAQRGDGPAITYRDGWKIYAWNGIAVPEQWILNPEAIPARELKHVDASFRAYVETRVPRVTGKKASARRKRSDVFTMPLPADADARLARLKESAGGALPLFTRYTAGDHVNVWTDLVRLGDDVRFDPHAPDALAVAYETMRRVDHNVRTVVQRLREMNYAFTTEASRSAAAIERMESLLGIDLDRLAGGATPPMKGLFDMVARAREMLGGQVERLKQQPKDPTDRAHVPPGPETRKAILALEREVGPIPLSLRAFYEVVGSVNLIGTHPSLAPRQGDLAPDPLVVYGIDGAVEDDEDEAVIIIAPDDLHKADTSGGAPYTMAIPDARADGELLDERHQLFFVDYLRLAFRFGGFPGYEGQDVAQPPELARLRSGLLEF